MVPRRGGFLSRLTNPASLPHWLTEADVDFYVSEFARTGFRGGLNWYRNMDRNWELLAPVSGVQVTVPALYIAGDRDLVLAFRGWTKSSPTCRSLCRSFGEPPDSSPQADLPGLNAPGVRFVIASFPLTDGARPSRDVRTIIARSVYGRIQNYSR